MAMLLGGIAFVEIPVDLMPETEYPTLSVNVAYPGVAPQEMETLVARPLEQALAATPGVEETTSSSSESRASVRLRFAYGTDLDEAAAEMRSRIDRRRSTLPDEMEPPTLYKYDVSQYPIMYLTVASPEMDSKELRFFAEKNLQYRLERAVGVAATNISGGLRRQIHVNLSLKKLRALNLSANDIVTTLRNENLNRPVGPVQEGRYEVLVRTEGEFDDVEDILGVAIANRGGVKIYLRDIATVEDSHEDVRYMVSVNGDPAVRVFVYKQSGANTVDVAKVVREEVAQFNKDYDNVSVSIPFDSSGVHCGGGGQRENRDDRRWRAGGVCLAVFPAQHHIDAHHRSRHPDLSDLDIRLDVFQRLHAKHRELRRLGAGCWNVGRQRHRCLGEYLPPPRGRLRW